VRSPKSLEIEPVAVTKPELQLALQLIEQISTDSYDPKAYEDEEKKRVLAAIDAKIAGQQIVASHRGEEPAEGAQVIDLMEALRASLDKKPKGDGARKPAEAHKKPAEGRKPAKRAQHAEPAARKAARK
jgi:DNA end-binding protein Ku